MSFLKIIAIIFGIYLLIGLIHVFIGFPLYWILIWPAPYIAGIILGFKGANLAP